MRQEYITPELKIKRIDFSDIITSSLTGDQEKYGGQDNNINETPADENPFVTP